MTRWYPLRPHAVQMRLADPAGPRFRVVPAGRRSGKTEHGKRYLVRRALEFQHPRGKFVAAAPTRDQAKRLYWEDLKRLVPIEAIKGRPREGELIIPLLNGAEIHVVGMDVPERIEGDPLDGIVLDEYANMKKHAWSAHVRPALSTPGRPPGWGWFVGVPEGRNHYYDLYTRALEDDTGGWGAYTWPSRDIMDPAEIAELERDMDPMIADQELNASFVNFTGAAYHQFQRETHAARTLPYDPLADLLLAFDFNVAPGVAVVCQEVRLPPGDWPVEIPRGEPITLCIGEVHIPRGSNTERVCQRLIRDWGSHQGRVICYGDATGGASGTAKVAGSDWEIIRNQLRPVFTGRLSLSVPNENPRERVRVNTMNGRLRNVAGEVRMLVDPKKAPNLIKDFEGVAVLEGGSGELDKSEKFKEFTHMTDALGYLVHRRHPAGHESFDMPLRV